MFLAGHMGGGAPVIRKLKLGASVSSAGIPVLGSVAGVIPATTTSLANAMGICFDTGTYATATEALVTVNIRPDQLVRARMSGGATTGTSLTEMTQSSASTTVLSCTSLPNVDLTTGTMWGDPGFSANVGLSRHITSGTGAVSATVTVAFPNSMAVGDKMLVCPWNTHGIAGGAGNVQLTSDFLEANAIIVPGTGGVASVWELELNGPADSYVTFVFQDHTHGVDTA